MVPQAITVTSSTLTIGDTEFALRPPAALAVDETAILLHPSLPVAGVSIVTARGRQQNEKMSTAQAAPELVPQTLFYENAMHLHVLVRGAPPLRRRLSTGFSAMIGGVHCSLSIKFSIELPVDQVASDSASFTAFRRTARDAPGPAALRGAGDPAHREPRHPHPPKPYCAPVQLCYASFPSKHSLSAMLNRLLKTERVSADFLLHPVLSL